jgi:hypothetical protein
MYILNFDTTHSTFPSGHSGVYLDFSRPQATALAPVCLTSIQTLTLLARHMLVHLPPE